MTPESIQLAREITEAAIFDAGERRTECLCQAEDRPEARVALLQEAKRLKFRMLALHQLDAELECELKQEAAVPGPSGGGDIFS